MDSRSKAKIWAKNAERLKKRIRHIKAPVGMIGSKAKKETKFKQGWREFGGKRIFYRSKWEANFGRFLQWQKEQGLIKEWLHEPQTFWFEGVRRGCVTYLPDFKVTYQDDRHEWVEVKGWMDPKSKTKISRFRKYFPKESLRIVGSTWYKSNNHKLSVLIPGWEKG